MGVLIICGVGLVVILIIGILWTGANSDVCSNCGYYCTGKSIYCTPPVVKMKDND